jgi:hypothetical protein
MTKKYHPEGYLQKCIVCKEDVLQSQDKKMIAIEKPYLNLYVHLLCYKEIENNLKEFMNENLEEFLKNDKNKY